MQMISDKIMETRNTEDKRVRKREQTYFSQ